jgi:hypothetical protein
MGNVTPALRSSVIFRLIFGEDQRLVTVCASANVEPSAGFYINLYCLGTSNFESLGTRASFLVDTGQ